MKILIYLSLILLPFGTIYARDPGTGSNTTVGPGPTTPDAGASDTSIMGGGTPGNQGINNLGIDEPTEEELDTMYRQRQEEPVKEKGDDEVTDQDKDLNTIQDL